MTTHVGTVVRTTDAATLRALCSSGLDWLMLDGEHPLVGLSEIAEMLRVIDGRLRCYVRVPAPDAEWVTRALEWGAEGIVFPNVDDAEQARSAVQLVRDSRWPLARVVVQAETAAAVEQIDSIVRVPGVDWVLIGPNDLTKSLGIPGDFDAPVYRNAVASIAQGCKGAGIPVGIFGMTPEHVDPYEDRGFSWLLVGIDRPA